jgi:hypothetical protein
MANKQTILTFKRVRILILLIILISVAGGTYIQRNLTANWLRPLEVTIYPINGDGTVETTNYIRSLTMREFSPIEQFFHEEAEAYDLVYAPTVNTELGPEIHSIPPAPPSNSEDRFAIAKWSLSLRHWVYQQTDSFGLDARHVRIFVIYYKAQKNHALAHSIGLQKGLIGVVNAFAGNAQRDQNKVIITHELLHTLGATDKYLANGMPRYPDGYAEPDKDPLYPQEFAEIMAGRFATSGDQAEIPRSLDQCEIGPRTAHEINWI